MDEMHSFSFSRIALAESAHLFHGSFVSFQLVVLLKNETKI